MTIQVTALRHAGQTGNYSFARINAGRAVSAVSAEQQRAVKSACGTTLAVSMLVALLFLCAYAAHMHCICAELVNMSSSSSLCLPVGSHC